MIRWLKIVSLVSFISLSLGVAVAAEQTAPVKPGRTELPLAYFTKLPSARDVQISPDGKYLSVVMKIEGEDMLGILEQETLKPISRFRVRGAGKAVGKVRWVNNTRVVYSITESHAWDKEVFENGELYAANADGSDHKIIFGYQVGDGGNGSRIKKRRNDYGDHEIVSLLDGDDDNILLVFYPWRLVGKTWKSNREAQPIVYKLDVYSGKKRKVDNLPMPLSDALADNAGNVRFAIGIDDNNNSVISYKQKPADEWQAWSLKEFEGTRIYPLSFSQDNQSIYLMANVGQGTRALYLYDLKSKTAKIVKHDPNVDITSFIRDFADQRIIGVGTDLGLPDYHYLQEKHPLAILHQRLLVSFPGNDVVMTSASTDGSKVIVYAYSDAEAGNYFLFDTKTVQARWLMSNREWLDPALLSSTQAIRVKTRDGLTVGGYLTLPPDKSKGLPMVVLPHGGPHGVRDYWGFDWEVQLLANRGYAVLQLNYRGSGGFGVSFEDAGKGNWGTSMQDDLTDATKAMIAQGIADPAKICLLGASYGGYAALMGAVREPDLYRCVIGSAGVYNLPMMFKEGDIADRQRGLAYLKEVLGEDQADLKRRSPAYNADKIKAAVLLIHGAKDQRAPIEQVESLMAAFDAIDKPYQYLKISNEAHGYFDEANRERVYQKVLAFLHQQLN